MKTILNKWLHWKNINILLLIINVIFTYNVFTPHNTAHPPINIDDLIIIAVGTPVAWIIIVGAQYALSNTSIKWTRPSLSKNPVNFQQPVYMLFIFSIWMFVSGLSILIQLPFHNEFTLIDVAIYPTLGFSSLIGTCACFLIYKKKFEH